MSDKSGIAWTDATWNPVAGCKPVSAGCLNCYAATMARRLEAMGQDDYAPRVPSVDEQAARHAAGVRVPPSLDKTIRIAEVRGGRAVFTGEVRTVPERLTVPLHWRKPRRVFVNSMSDLFHEAVPFEFIAAVYGVAAACPQHTFQVLTKRPERMAKFYQWLNDSHQDMEIARCWAYAMRLGPIDDCAVWRGARTWPLPNVWLGTSVEDQKAADERIPHLLRCPAAVRWLSCEPLLGEVDLPEALLGHWTSPDGTGSWFSPVPGKVYRRLIHWAVFGGESGAHARPCDVAWVRSLRDQCKAARVPCFVKQLGRFPLDFNASEWPDAKYRQGGHPKLIHRAGADPAEWPEDLRVMEWPA